MSIENLSNWLEIGKGTVDLTTQYAKEDMAHLWMEILQWIWNHLLVLGILVLIEYFHDILVSLLFIIVSYIHNLMFFLLSASCHVSLWQVSIY